MAWRKTWPWLVGVGAVALLASNLYQPSPDPHPQPKVRRGKPPLELASPHLQKANTRIEQATKQHFGAVSQLFDQARQNSGAFAKTALGWSSKWRIVADAVPFTRGDRNVIYLREQFEKQVLSGKDLEKAIEHCVQEFLDDIRSIESKMLVDLKADMEGFSNEYKIGSLSDQEIQAQFEAAIHHAMEIAGKDLQSNINSQLVSIVVGEVLTQVAIRLGVSAGILGTGAATGWATLGIGVIVGIIIDQIVMTIWSHWSDPEANLITILDQQLITMENIICVGGDDSNGLFQHFQSIAKERSQLRRAAVLELLGVEDGSLETVPQHTHVESKP